jgi:acetylornithine deacetylase/succinyl-diaminopimelate desuccinylase-like protein
MARGGGSSERFFLTLMFPVLLGGIAWAQTSVRTSGPSTTPALSSAAIPAERLSEYANLSVRWMQEYLQVNTTNPPGNELRAATFFRKIFEQEGIENRVLEYAPGRADFWARVPHTTPKAERPIVLLNHMDVVTSDSKLWKVPPFSGSVVDGFMYGRGAQDMKSVGLAQLVVMVMLKRERVQLDRDIIFLGTADEEVSGTGSDWIIEHERGLLGNAEYLLTEGGANLLDGGRVDYIGVDVAEKTTFWLRLVARGRPGHGSRPIRDSAPNRLLRALNRIINKHPPLKILPFSEEFLRTMGPRQFPRQSSQFLHVRQSIKSKAFQDLLEGDEFLNSMLHNTVSLTMLGGSEQTNVIPSSAWANLDVRLLPGEDPAQFLMEIRKLVADDNITVQPLEPKVRMGNSSPSNTLLFSAIRKVAHSYFPGSPVVPRLPTGYTESQRYRSLGMVAYGFSPYALTAEEKVSEHGNDERIRVEELRRGFLVLYDVINETVSAQASQ